MPERTGDSQTTIPIPDIKSGNHICQWCGDLAVEELQLEKERYRYVKRGDKRVKEVAKRAITAFVCKKHRDILVRNNEVLQKQKEEELDISKQKPNWFGWGRQNG